MNNIRDHKNNPNVTYEPRNGKVEKRAAGGSIGNRKKTRSNLYFTISHFDKNIAKKLIITVLLI